MKLYTLVRKGTNFPPFASPFEVKKHVFLCIEDIDSRNVLKVDTSLKYMATFTEIILISEFHDLH